MDPEDFTITPNGSDCVYRWCSNNSCGLGGLQTIEYCYDGDQNIIATRCGCKDDGW